MSEYGQSAFPYTSIGDGMDYNKAGIIFNLKIGVIKELQAQGYITENECKRAIEKITKEWKGDSQS